MKYQSYKRSKGKLKRILEALEMLLYFILTGVFVLIVWIIEEALRTKVAHISELDFSKFDTLVFLSNSLRYDFIVAISIGIIFVTIGCCFLKRRISKLAVPLTLICIIIGIIGLNSMLHSYINITYDGFYVGGAVSKEKSYKFENINKIQSYCTKRTGKNGSSYEFKYSIIMNDGDTIELSKDIDENEIYKLDKVHRLFVDKYKINYYCTGVNDPYYNLLLDRLYNDDNKKAIKDIFEDKTQRPLV